MQKKLSPLCKNRKISIVNVNNNSINGKMSSRINRIVTKGYQFAHININREKAMSNIIHLKTKPPDAQSQGILLKSFQPRGEI